MMDERDCDDAALFGWGPDDELWREAKVRKREWKHAGKCRVVCSFWIDFAILFCVLFCVMLLLGVSLCSSPLSI